MKYGILARDEYTAGSDDGDLYVLIVQVDADSRAEAYDKAKQLAETNGLEVEAKHDGSACYEIVQTDEELKDAMHRLRLEHNAPHDLAKIIDTTE